tara:strand:- start:4852 stop:5952 length:1101 start_codon:yes stop_codon:yes gene_type:complete
MFEFDEYAEICQEFFPSSSILDSTSVIHNGNIISDSRSIVISPLNDLIFAPKTAKQYLHSANRSLGKNENHSLDFFVRQVLDEAMKIISRDIGEKVAKEWRKDTFNLVKNIIAVDDLFGILDGEYSLIKIEKLADDSAFEISESLELPYGEKRLVIGQRKTRYGESCENLENWEIKNDMDEIFGSLVKLNDSISQSSNPKRFHFFVWSDQPISRFQKSLVKQVFHDSIYSSQNTGNYVAKALIFISKDDEHSTDLETLNSMERLAISRGQKAGRIYLSPGKYEDVFTDDNMRYNRPSSVFESAYIEHMVSRTKLLGLFDSNVVQSERVVIESTNDLVENSAMVISVDCWIGTWAKSLEVDGEQVII